MASKLILGGCMTKIKNTFESAKELKQLSIKRLFNNQKLMLKELDYYLYVKEDKNLVNEYLQNVIVINKVIEKKLEKIK